MRKIIKGAFTKFETECQKCGCKFEYEFDDILCDWSTHDLDVICPDCGFYTPHCYEDGLPSSRKEVEPDKPEEMGEGWCDEIKDILRRIEGQMECGYIDLGYICDEDEFNLVYVAIEEYKKNHSLGGEK